MATFYTGVDKERYDAGNKFLPQNRFLLNYTPPAVEEEVTTSYGIPNTNAFVNSGGGGGGVNYRTDYRPNYEYRQYVDGYDPNLTATMNMKMMEMDPNYKGPDYYNPPAPTGLAKGINAAIDFIPGIGMIKKGAEFLGDTFGKFMPVNQRAIMENELRGAGVYTDDIGRIVAGEGGYNTPEGIMAGYNANQMTEKTFDKRTDTIAKTLDTKYGIDITDPNFDPSTIDEDDAAYDLVNRYGLINQAKINFFNTKKKADEIYEFEKKQKEDEKLAAKGQIRLGSNLTQDTTYKSDPALSKEGKEKYTGEGMAFEKRDTGTGRGPRKDGGRVGLRYGGLLSIL
jgi:hypothetical protein